MGTETAHSIWFAATFPSRRPPDLERVIDVDCQLLRHLIDELRRELELESRVLREELFPDVADESCEVIAVSRRLVVSHGDILALVEQGSDAPPASQNGTSTRCLRALRIMVIR
jgi:hypothetical protein